jgi:hypothetical protein
MIHAWSRHAVLVSGVLHSAGDMASRATKDLLISFAAASTGMVLTFVVLCRENQAFLCTSVLPLRREIHAILTPYQDVKKKPAVR